MLLNIRYIIKNLDPLFHDYSALEFESIVELKPCKSQGNTPRLGTGHPSRVMFPLDPGHPLYGEYKVVICVQFQTAVLPCWPGICHWPQVIVLLFLPAHSRGIPPEWAGRNNNTITRGRRQMPSQHGSLELDVNHCLVLAIKRMTWIKGKHHPRWMTCAKSRSVTLALAGLKLDNTFKLQCWIVTEQRVKVLDDVLDVQQHKYTTVEWVSPCAWLARHNWWLKILWQVFLALAGLKFELKK